MTDHDTFGNDSVFNSDSESEDIYHDTMDDILDTTEITTEKNPANTRQHITINDLNNLMLAKVKLTSCVLGQGSYGTVYKAEHNGMACAAKRVDLSVTHTERVEQNFLLECLQHSKLSHPNIVKMLGVFYPEKETLPVLVMELMEYNLTQLLKRSHNIPTYVKLSILQDVSRGLCYLRAQNPPIVHQALYSDNILFTKGLIATLSDFKTGAETVSDQALLSTRRNRASNDFLPDSYNALKYELPLNVFSFGCVACHVITQKWPSRQHNNYFKEQRSVKPYNISLLRRESDPVQQFLEYDYTDLTMRYMVADWCIEKHQYYVNQIDNNVLKHLVEACLQRNSKYRPHMSQICNKITSIMKGEFMRLNS